MFNSSLSSSQACDRHAEGRAAHVVEAHVVAELDGGRIAAVLAADTQLDEMCIRDRDYTVAACWEFIIPGVGMDIPNIGAVCLATVVHDVIEKKLAQCCAFDELMEAVGQELVDRADKLEASLRPIFIEPAPYQSVLMSDWSHDISEGAKYKMCIRDSRCPSSRPRTPGAYRGCR